MFKSLGKIKLIWNLFFIIPVIMFALQGTSTAVQITATWTGGVDNWNDAGNWDSANVPNNGVDNYDVRIDNDGGTGSIIALDISTTIDSLTVDNGDTLNFNNTQDLTIAGGGVTNNGAINMNGVSSFTDFTFQGGITLDGTGEIVMSNSLQNRILTDNTTMTQAVNHSIEGAGQIIAPMINNGTVDANQINQLRLSINNKTNNGLMRASNGSTLHALAGVDVDGTGRWEADGGTIQLDSGVNVTTTGNIDILNGGRVALSGASMTGNNLNMTGAGSSISVNSSIELTDNFLYDITTETDFVWGATSSLQMNGFNSFLELGGQDFGTDPINHVGDAAGFSLNFDLTELIIGSGAKVHLADFFDNANRIEHGFGTSEALYVDTLTFADTSGLLNLNGLHLYFNTLNGLTSQMIDEAAPPLEPIPEPTTIALLGIGFAGLGGGYIRRRIRHKAKP